MSSTMRDWIAPTAEREILKAFDAFASDYKPGQKGEYVWNSDRATVHLKEGRQIQVIDFNGQSRSPFDVIVSDGTTSIGASFTSSSTKEFSRKNNRNFTDKICGAILVITDYHLIYQPFAVPGKKLTLKVSQFKLRGSEGSKVFGRPSNVEELQGVLHAMCIMDEHLFSAVNDDAEPPEMETDILSQPSDFEGKGGPWPTDFRTQATFASQLPTKVAGKTSQPKGTIPASINKGADLMALLANLSKPTAPESHPDERSASDVAIKPTRKNPKNIQKLSVLQPVSGGRKAEMSSILGAKANERRSQSSIASSDSKNRPLQVKERNVPISSNYVPDNDNEKENSQESMNKEKHLVAIPKVRKLDPVAEPEPEISTLLIDKAPGKNPFEGLKRVPKSYVRVPESQQKILDRTDSWYQPGADSRSSYANIPPEVLRDLNSFIDLQSDQRKNGDGAAEIRVEQETEDEEMDGTEEGDDRGEIAEGLGIDRGEEGPDDYFTRRTGIQGTTSNHNDKPPAKMLQQTIFSSTDLQARDGSEHPEDAESVEDFVSWSGSSESDANQHRDLEPDDLEIPPLSSSSNLGNDSRKSSAVGAANMTTNIPSSPPQGAIAQLPSPAHTSGSVFRHPARDFNFPSSSPGDEEELELVVPHAIDDEVLEFAVEMLEEPKTSQKLPSTAHMNHPVIQVEQTPYHFQQNAQVFEDIGRQDTKQVNAAFKGLKRGLEAIASDPIIPGTFHNTSSQDRPAVQPVVARDQHELPHMGPHTLDVHNFMVGNENESDIAKGLLSTQHEKKTTINSSPAKYPSLTLEASSSRRPTTPQKHKMSVSNQEAASHILSQSMPLPVDTSSSARRLEYGYSSPDDGSPLKPSSLKRVGDRVQSDAQMLKRRRLIKPEELNLSQEECVARNTSEMARFNRQKFMGRDSESKTAPPMVQIAQSQPKSPAATWPSQDRPSTEDIFPQSVADFVRSSVPENVEAAEHGGAIQTTDDRNALEIAGSKNLKRKARDELYEEALEIISIASDSDWNDEAVTPICKEDVHVEPSRHPSAFDKFKAVYPTYGGTMKRFVEALVYIEWLLETKGDGFLRASLWDDFIRSLFHEHLDYVRRTGEKAKTGFSYFNTLDKPPLFQDRVITPDNLQDALWTLDVEQVEKLRSQFKKSSSRIEPSHGLPFVASQQSWEDLPNDDVADSASVDTTRDAMDILSPSPRSMKAPDRITSKRPFFETHSQVQAGKGKPSFRTSVEPAPDIEVPRSSESTTRRSLPWHQNDTLETGPTPPLNLRDATTISTIVTSSQTPKDKRNPMARLQTSPPFRGSPASPILGNHDFTLTSQSFIQTKQTPRLPTIGPSSRSPKNGSTPTTSSSLSHDHDIFKSPSIPVSKAALLERENSSPLLTTIDDKDKVDGWLDAQKSVTTADSALPVVKKKTPRLGSHPVSGSGSGVAKRPTVAPSATPTTSGVRKKMSFENFIRRRMSGRLSSNASTPSSSAAKRMPSKDKETERRLAKSPAAEPQTQAFEF